MRFGRTIGSCSAPMHPLCFFASAVAHRSLARSSAQVERDGHSEGTCGPVSASGAPPTYEDALCWAEARPQDTSLMPASSRTTTTTKKPSALTTPPPYCASPPLVSLSPAYPAAPVPDSPASTLDTDPHFLATPVQRSYFVALADMFEAAAEARGKSGAGGEKEKHGCGLGVPVMASRGGQGDFERAFSAQAVLDATTMLTAIERKGRATTGLPVLRELHNLVGTLPFLYPNHPVSGPVVVVSRIMLQATGVVRVVE